jgi:hypothetical protein
MIDPAARQRARDAAADQIATHHEVICPKNSGFAPPPTPRRHGTYSSYTGGCRCDLCADARRAYMRQKKTKQQAPHGTNYGYSKLGCRCEHCREAQRLYKAAYRAAKKAAD